MNAEWARALLLRLPQVVEKAQFGGIVFSYADLALGGKMFCLVNPELAGGLPVSFLSTAEQVAELLEREALRPAPYLARAHWIAAERWDALTDREWDELLRTAHALAGEKLAPKTRRLLELPPAVLRQLATERGAMLATQRAEAKKRRAARRHTES